MARQMLAQVPFVAFEAAHLAALGAILLAAAALALLLRLLRGGPGERVARASVCLGLAAVIVAVELIEHVWSAFAGLWSLERSLPLHLCDFAMFAAVVALLASAFGRQPSAWPGVGDPRAKPVACAPGSAGQVDQRQPAAAEGAKPVACAPGSAGGSRAQNGPAIAYELAYFWALGGSTQAVLTPELESGFPHPAFVVFFTSHGAVLVAVAILTIGLGLRPRRGALLRTWAVTNALAAIVAGVNWLIAANYMYLCGPPLRPSLYDYFGPWPWSLLTLEAVGTLVLALLYAPFWIADRRRRSG